LCNIHITRHGTDNFEQLLFISQTPQPVGADQQLGRLYQIQMPKINFKTFRLPNALKSTLRWG